MTIDKNHMAIKPTYKFKSLLLTYIHCQDGRESSTKHLQIRRSPHCPVSEEYTKNRMKKESIKILLYNMAFSKCVCIAFVSS